MPDKLWAPLTEINLVAVIERQIKFAEYLNERGIPTSAVTPRWCEKFPEICFAQAGSTLSHKCEQDTI